MSTAHANAFLGAIFETVDLGATNVIHNTDFDFDVANGGGSDQHLIVICHQQDALKVELFTRFHGQAIHFNGAPFDGTVLLAATFDNCKSHFLFSSHHFAVYLRRSYSRRLRTGKLGGVYVTASAIPTAEAEADGIIHVGGGLVQRRG